MSSVEEQIIETLVVDILASEQYTISVWDGEAFAVEFSQNLDEIMDALGHAEAEIICLTSNEDGSRHAGRIWLIYGNDGHDVVHDYSSSLAPLLEGAEALAEALAAKENTNA